MRILVANAGSTSLKFKVFTFPGEQVEAECRIERVGDPNGGRFFYTDAAQTVEETRVFPGYEEGIRAFLACFGGGEIHAVGFKTVLSFGYYGVHLLTPQVMQGMEEALVVAPAHNSCYLTAIRTFEKVMPEVPRVGVFETAFHQTLPEEAYTYSIPYEWRDKYGLRRRGYHGASHSYVADCLTHRLGPEYKAVSCHMGGSTSLCAILDGKSVDTSFGLSLQVGLPQSNRAGDLDPFFIFYLMEKEGLTSEEIKTALSKDSGLKGISGLSGDMRDLEAAARTGHHRARLAIDMYVKELLRYIGGYAAQMGGLDAIAFTGGLGENSALIRNKVMEKLAFLGVQPVETQLSGITCITKPGRGPQVWVIPANEELGVARRTRELLLGGHNG